METSLKRNQERFEKSGGEDRSLLPGSVLSAWKGVTQNFKDYQKLLLSNNIIIDQKEREKKIIKNPDQWIWTHNRWKR